MIVAPMLVEGHLISREISGPSALPAEPAIDLLDAVAQLAPRFRSGRSALLAELTLDLLDTVALPAEPIVGRSPRRDAPQRLTKDAGFRVPGSAVKRPVGIESRLGNASRTVAPDAIEATADRRTASVARDGPGCVQHAPGIGRAVR
jgi:hypothetical protein